MEEEKYIFAKELIKETVKEMVDDGELILVRDVTGKIALGYRRELLEGSELRTTDILSLDNSEDLEIWGIYSAQ